MTRSVVLILLVASFQFAYANQFRCLVFGTTPNESITRKRFLDATQPDRIQCNDYNLLSLVATPGASGSDELHLKWRWIGGFGESFLDAKTTIDAQSNHFSISNSKSTTSGERYACSVHCTRAP